MPTLETCVCGSKCSQKRVKSLNSYCDTHTEWFCPKCANSPVFKTKKSWNNYAIVMKMVHEFAAEYRKGADFGDKINELCKKLDLMMGKQGPSGTKDKEDICWW